MADSILIRDLSGGQKALLKFAVLSLRPAHILFLDEPTNHLDAHACEVLANALDEFEGGIVAATHDDLLIYRLIQCSWSVSELLVCQGGHVRRQAALGAHCMNALKEEVRKSEISTKLCNSKADAVAVTTVASAAVPREGSSGEVEVADSEIVAPDAGDAGSGPSPEPKSKSSLSGIGNRASHSQSRHDKDRTSESGTAGVSRNVTDA